LCGDVVDAEAGAGNEGQAVGLYGRDDRSERIPLDRGAGLADSGSRLAVPGPDSSTLGDQAAPIRGEQRLLSRAHCVTDEKFANWDRGGLIEQHAHVSGWPPAYRGCAPQIR
jgi:hypothetical protein